LIDWLVLDARERLVFIDNLGAVGKNWGRSWDWYMDWLRNCLDGRDFRVRPIWVTSWNLNFCEMLSSLLAVE